MGYSDIGSYGAEVIDTPTLDQLASGGLRFTQFYNTARCVPTRASLLTGLYQHQTGLGHMTGDDHLPGYRGDLNEHSLTIAQVLNDAGYSTYMSGKWHVTPYRPENPDKHNWPLQRGFDRFFGTIIGAGSYYDPNGLVRENKYISPRQAGEKYTNENFYYTTAISDYAVRYINNHEEKNSDNPFFVYVSYTAPHWPLHAPQEEIEKYKGKFDIGWDQLRQRRHQRMKEMGLIKEEWNLTKRDPEVQAWDQVKNKEWQARRMEVYAAQIDIMDQGIGRIVDALEQTGELENTLLLFLHDNGGNHENLEWIEWKNYPEHEGIEPLDRDEPQTEMFPKVTRQGSPVQHGNMPEYMPGPPDTYQSYGRPWGNASNTPFREYKKFGHEGGIATPLIAHWPSGIQRAGELERQPGHVVDLMKTFVDLADATYPETYNGNEIRPMQGVSLVPAFHGKDLSR
jgi:arylsulfatase